MRKVYGLALLINSIVLLLLLVAGSFAIVTDSQSASLPVNLPLLFLPIGVGVWLLILGYRLLIRSVRVLKGSIPVFSPQAVFKKIIFSSGFALLVLSAVLHLADLTLMACSALMETGSFPVGTASGLGLVVFILSQLLLGPTLKTHDNSLQPAHDGTVPSGNP
jgi:hypothetical protein